MTFDPDTAPALPVYPKHGRLSPLRLEELRILDGFWASKQRIQRTVSLEHAHDWMTKLDWIQNFKDAAGAEPYTHRGRPFADSEVYKLIEALCWSIYSHPDAELERLLDSLISSVQAAQEPDGYLHTLYGRPWQSPRYSDMMHGHELYCFGHFIQAAIAHYRATGADTLLNSAVRLADHVCTMFGEEGKASICGHPEIEMALVELYRTTKDRRYLDQASSFINRRGYQTLPPSELGQDYWQDSTPVRESEVLHGHAVRALYLASGAVDTAVETEDSELLTVIAQQWERTVARRTYITGGMGSHHMDEAFGEDFVLPADRSYCETCAGVASIMLSWRLLLATGEAQFADLIERTLYNIVATSTSADGKAFFYANTLHQRHPREHAALNRDGVAIRGGSAGRQGWFEVSCCPPNLARMLGSLEGYIATTTTSGIQLHQLVPAHVETNITNGLVELEVSTDYPANGTFEINVLQAPKDGFELAIRVPSWAENSTVQLGTQKLACAPGTYKKLQVHNQSQIRLTIPIASRASYPDPRIDAVRGTVAFERGPEVLALESHDLPEGWDIEHVQTTGQIRDREDGPWIELQRRASSEIAWAYLSSPSETVEDAEWVRLTPYHEWAERGPSAMRVFIQTPRTHAEQGPRKKD